MIDRGSLVYHGPTDRFLAQAAPTVTAMPEHAAELERLVAIVRAQGLEADRDA